MREHEAERAAARRNREDPRRDRFVFYALDESAGLAPDAWEVAMRLRRDDERPPGRSKPSRRSHRSPQLEAPAPAAVWDAEPAAMQPEAMEPVATEEAPREPMAIELLARGSVAAEPPPAVAPATEPAPEPVDEPTAIYDAELDTAPPQEPAAVAEAAMPEPGPPPARRRRRFGLVRMWGVFVMLVGLTFVAAVLTVAIAFRDYTHLGTVVWGIGVAAGLFAMWVGFALARHRR